MKDRVCLVTGANTGIGLETARGLARQGAVVVMTARTRSKGEAAVADVIATTGNAQVSLLDLDLSSLASIRAAAAAFPHQQLHVLVNNAGLMLGERQETAEGLEMTIGVNHFGPFALTLLLLPLLRAAAPSRIVNVSSAAHRVPRGGLDFDDLMYTRRDYKMMGAYGASKLANILFTRELSRRLAGSDVTVNAVHPGAVGSRFASDGDVGGWFESLMKLGRPLLLTPARGARTSLHVATSAEGGRITGAYFARSRQASISRAARDDQAASRLWALSEALTGLSLSD